MGADYILIPLMAAEQFGVNTLARAMGIILPLNTIGQTWCPYLVSVLRQHYGNYVAAMVRSIWHCAGRSALRSP